MMESRMKPIRQIALSGALSLLALASIAPGAARAQSGDSGLFDSMLKTLGIGGENNIEYRERPPLVVPPTRELPPPQAAGAARDPKWPADVKSAAQPKKGNTVRDLDKLPVPQRPVEPSLAGAGAPAPTGGSPETTAAIPQPQPAPTVGFFGRLFSGTEMPPNAVIPVPERKSLTQPPLGYESPAPGQYGTASPAAPAKATPEGALQTQPGASGL
jgi:hypothetical protein